MIAYTDYPLPLDPVGQVAPIRSVIVLTYDGNKYCHVLYVETQIFAEVKAGYLYSEHGRLGEVPIIDATKLPRSNDDA